MAAKGSSSGGQRNRPLATAVVAALVLGLFLTLSFQSAPGVRRDLDSTRAWMDDVSSRLAPSPYLDAPLFQGEAKRQETIAELKAQIRALEHWRDTAEIQRDRLSEYEKALDLLGEPQGEAVTARVVAEADSPFSETLVANAGRDQGVEEGSAVVNAHGLVGRVIRVGQTSSRVLKLTDYNSRVPVMGRSSRDRALLVGDRVTGARLLHPETPDAIIEGEEWVTSGDDGLLPRGLLVGYAKRDKEGWAVELMMHRAPLDFVRLVAAPGSASPDDPPDQAPEPADGPGDEPASPGGAP